MEKLKINQIKRIAKMHAAICLLAADACMFELGSKVSEQDQDLIVNEVHKIALKLAGNNPVNLGSTPAIIDYVLTNRP